MNKYFEAPVWNNEICPSTNYKAEAKDLTTVQNRKVILVEDAAYRDANINGVFCLAEKSQKGLPYKGKRRVEVYALWYGCRLKTRGIKILVDFEKAYVSDNYSGEVVSNIYA
jgi:hypothetical protein